MYEEEAAKDARKRTLPVFQRPKSYMLQGIQDLFDLIADGFKKEKFVEGVKRSFISTGCVPLDDSDVSAPTFQEYSKSNICGTIKSVPTGTVEDTDDNSNNDRDIVISEGDT